MGWYNQIVWQTLLSCKVDDYDDTEYCIHWSYNPATSTISPITSTMTPPPHEITFWNYLANDIFSVWGLINHFFIMYCVYKIFTLAASFLTYRFIFHALNSLEMAYLTLGIEFIWLRLILNKIWKFCFRRNQRNQSNTDENQDEELYGLNCCWCCKRRNVDEERSSFINERDPSVQPADDDGLNEVNLQ